MINPAKSRPGLSNSYSDLYWISPDGLQVVARQWTVPAPQGSVLIVHGIGDHSGRFEHVADFLNAAGYSVLVPDLRGHGRSDGKRGYVRDFDVLLDDVDISLQKSREICAGPAFLYGQSMGALLAIYYVLKRTPAIAGLIATSPALRIAMPAPPWKVAVGKVLRTVLPNLSLDSGLDSNELSDDPQVAARISSDRFRHRRVTPGAYFGMLETAEWCLQHANRLGCPALLMHGQLDRITDHTASMQFAEAADNCSIRIWKNGKHELHNMTNKHDVLAAITDFQSRCIREDSRNTD